MHVFIINRTARGFDAKPLEDKDHHFIALRDELPGLVLLKLYHLRQPRYKLGCLRSPATLSRPRPDSGGHGVTKIYLI